VGYLIGDIELRRGFPGDINKGEVIKEM